MISGYKTVLLVEDDEDDQLLFTDALENMHVNLKLDIAGSGDEAFNKLETAEELPDLIFLDINMPSMNGMEFLYEIKKNEHLSGIPVVIFTTSNNPDHIKQSKVLGASGYLVKPPNFDRLSSKLRNIFVSDLIDKRECVKF